MNKFYWIDTYNEYDSLIVAAVKKQFEELYRPLAAHFGLQFEFVDAADLLCVVGDSATKILWSGKNILEAGNSGYVGTYNPSPSVEQRLKTLHSIAAESSDFRLVNRSRSFINPDNDKFFALSLSDQLGIKAIPSILVPHSRNLYSQLENIVNELGGFPLIAKPKDMLAGMGITRVSDKMQLKGFCESVSYGPKGFMIQKFIDIQADIRVFYSEGEILCSLWRIPTEENGLGNISQGARSEVRESIPEELRESVLAIADRVKASYLCIDFLYDGRDYFFSEIETGGGFSGLDESHKIRVAKAFFGAMA